MESESRRVAGVLEAIGLASNRFRAIANALDATLERVQVSKPDWDLWFEPRDPSGVVGVYVRVHLPPGSLSWSLTVLWRSGVDRQLDSEWGISIDQAWSFWRPLDGSQSLRESERRAVDADGLRSAILAAVQEIDQWLAVTDFDVLSDPIGLDPNNGRHGEALDEVWRRLSISGGEGVCQ